MKQVFCTLITGQESSFTVLVETSPKFPFHACNISFVTVTAISMGEAAKKAIDATSYTPFIDCKPVVKAFYQ